MGNTLSPPQKKLAQELFKQLDHSGDGYLDVVELKNVIPIKEEKVKQMMNQFDANKDHKLDFNESVKLFESCYQTLFEDVDTDGDGTITGDEFQVFWEQFGENESVHDIREAFQRYDTNKDGTIDFAEFCLGLACAGVFY